MKSSIKFAVLIAIGALSFSLFQGVVSPRAARADTSTPILMITTDAFSGTFAINIVRDSAGEVTEMLYQTPLDPNGVLTLAQLHQGPQVIYSSQGHDAILLSLENDFDPGKGGHVVVRYLHNGADDSYKDFRVLVSITSTIVLTSDPNASDPDSDGNKFSGPFNRLYMEKNTFLGILVGIDDVVPSYQQP